MFLTFEKIYILFYQPSIIIFKGRYIHNYIKLNHLLYPVTTEYKPRSISHEILLQYSMKLVCHDRIWKLNLNKGIPIKYNVQTQAKLNLFTCLSKYVTTFLIYPYPICSRVLTHDNLSSHMAIPPALMSFVLIPWLISSKLMNVLKYKVTLFFY